MGAPDGGEGSRAVNPNLLRFGEIKGAFSSGGEEAKYPDDPKIEELRPISRVLSLPKDISRVGFYCRPQGLQYLQREVCYFLFREPLVFLVEAAGWDREWKRGREGQAG